VGGIACYLALTWISLKDARYALPALPYMAVLGTGWMVALRLPWRRVAIGALCVIALGNTIAAIGGTGRTVVITLPGATPSGLGERQLTLAKAGGWIVGPPETEGAVLKTMLAAKAAGATGIAFDPGAQQSNFNHPGLDIMSRVAGIPLADPYDLNNPGHVLISNRAPVPAEPPACAVTSAGMGVYLSTGLVEVPFEDRQFVCQRDGSVRLPSRTLAREGGR
jgi:hypothetical protein